MKILGVLMVSLVLEMNAQQKPETMDVLRGLTPDYEQSEVFQNQAEAWTTALTHPTEINSITREQLLMIPGLSEKVVDTFLAYRESRGPILSLYELQTIAGWDHATFDRARTFLFVRDHQTSFNASIFRRIWHEPGNFLLLRIERTLEPREGYRRIQSPYLGTPERMYLRFRAARAGDFSVGLACDKDAGEPWMWNPSAGQLGADFISFHIQLQNKGRWKSILLGDFQAQLGQGLVLGSVFGLGKNAETITSIRRASLGFVPYSSVQESGMLRGAAATYALHRHWQLSAFFSTIRLDARVATDSGGVVTSLPASGLHRTQTEMQLRQRQSRIDAGVALQYKTRATEVGVLAHHLSFAIPLQPATTRYNQFSFRGSENMSCSIFGSTTIGIVSIFGEAVHSAPGTAMSVGLQAAVTRRAELALHYRNFSRDFVSFNANAFEEGGAAQNEEGFYWGIKYQFNKQFLLTGYVDLFSFPWLRYRMYQPSAGRECLLRITATPNRHANIFFQFRETVKEVNGSGKVYDALPGVRRNITLQASVKSGPRFEFRTRIQYNAYHHGPLDSHGLALIQDAAIDLHRLHLDLRYALFDTDFETRVYTYEPDVWLAWSFPAYDGRGIRSCVLLRYDLSRHFSVGIRWARTMLQDQESIGSGGDLIRGNTRNDIKFQLRLNL